MSLAPRIVFFGMPLTGKTGLLHAFADPEAPFPLSKYGDERPANSDVRTLPGGVVLQDVDGRSAKEILIDPDKIERPDRTATAVREADAIVLAVDASASGESTIDLFRSFASFLEGLEGTRCRNREVGGLPIHLTLTKCDQLYQPGDTPTAWLARVEEKKRSIRTAFEDYLATSGSAGPNPDPFAFGSIDVRVAATALKFPNDPSFDALEAPFGIGDLREDCLAAAHAHARRSETSRRQLRWTLAGSGSLVGALAIALVSLFAISPPSESDRLGRRIKDYRNREGPPAHRLADRQFERYYQELRAIRDDAGFDSQPEAERKFVAERLTEFAAYREYRERFLPPRIGPAEVRARSEADTLEQELATILRPPIEYAETWRETEAARLAAKWSHDLELIRAAEAQLYDWYRGLVRRGSTLLVATGVDRRWRLEAQTLLEESRTTPFLPGDAIPGSEKLPLARGAAVTFTTAFESDRVERASEDWNATRQRVTAMRDLADVLGLTGQPDPLLKLPEPTDPREAEKWAAAMLAKLGSPDWSVDQFPDPIRSEFRRQLHQVRDAGFNTLHAILRNRRGAEDGESWTRVAAWLAGSDAKSWGAWLQRIGRWADRDAADPVAEASVFLNRTDFPADLSQLELTIPNDLRSQRLIPKGSLVVLQKMENAAVREISFSRVGDPVADGTAIVYPFKPDRHDGKPTFIPSEIVSAYLMLKSGDREFRLDWNSERSKLYSFDRLNREPTIRSTDENATGERAAGVRLTARNLPRLPAALRLD